MQKSQSKRIIQKLWAVCSGWWVAAHNSLSTIHAFSEVGWIQPSGLDGTGVNRFQRKFGGLRHELVAFGPGVHIELGWMEPGHLGEDLHAYGRGQIEGHDIRPGGKFRQGRIS